MQTKKGHYVVKTVPLTTNNITTAIINFLDSEGHQAMRINTQGQWSEEKQCWIRSGSTIGVADVLCCLSPVGRFFAVEVKFKKDKEKKHQKEWRESIIKAGGIAIVAHTLEDVIQFYNLIIKNILGIK